MAPNIPLDFPQGLIYNRSMSLPLRRHELTPTTPSDLSLQAQFLSKALNKMPLTQEGLPVGYYRADIANPATIPSDLEEEELQTQRTMLLRSAFVDLDYSQGYPTLPNGQPFWTRLDAEPGTAFSAFNTYLASGNDGPRQLHLLAEKDNELVTVMQAALNLQTLDAINNQLREWYALYAWKFRVKAYDLFREAAFRHQQVQRAQSSQENHYTIAESIINKVRDQFDKPDFWDALSGKEIIDAFKAAVAVQRISTGLPAAAPLPSKESSQMPTNFEMIMRQVVQRGAAPDTQPVEVQKERAGKFVDKVLRDPKNIRAMQEIIVRVTQEVEQEPDKRGPPGRGRTYDGASGLEIDTDDNITGVA
jgi:hypothetical protein